MSQNTPALQSSNSSSTSSDQSAQNNGEKIDILDVKQLNDALGILNVALHVGTKQGAYGLDEAVRIKMAYNSLVKGIENLDRCQSVLVKLNQQQQQAQAQGSTPSITE